MLWSFLQNTLVNHFEPLFVNVPLFPLTVNLTYISPSNPSWSYVMRWNHINIILSLFIEQLGSETFFMFSVNIWNIKRYKIIIKLMTCWAMFSLNPITCSYTYNLQRIVCKCVGIMLYLGCKKTKRTLPSICLKLRIFCSALFKQEGLCSLNSVFSATRECQRLHLPLCWLQSGAYFCTVFLVQDF